jgi:hypothetical protein
MEQCERFVALLYRVDFSDKSEQDALMAFAREVAKDDDRAVDLETLRWQRPIDKFTRKLSALSERQVRAIGDYAEFAKSVKSAGAPGGLARLVQRVNGSPSSLLAVEREITEAVDAINSNVPLIFPLQMHSQEPQSILLLRNKIRTLGPNVVLVKMQTQGCGGWRYYVLQRSQNSAGFHTSVVTLSSVLFLIGTIFKREYTTRGRSLGLFPATFFEIGLDTIAGAVKTRPRTLEMLFKTRTGQGAHDWLRENVVIASDGTRWRPDVAAVSARVPYAAPGVLRVTPAGKDSVGKFTNDSLKEFWVGRLTAEGFIESRQRFARSLAVCCVTRRLFNGPYPSLPRTVFTSDGIPVLHSDFDHGMITATDPSPYASLRLSPTVVEYLGPTLYGESIVAVGAIAKALVANIAPVRAFLEALIEAEDSEAKRRMKPGPELVAVRTALEERFKAIAPPAVACKPTARQACVDAMVNCITDARDESRVPTDGIPWF